MALYKYFKKVPNALPNPNGSLSGRMLSETIFSANREMSGSVHQDTGQNGKTINMTQGQHSSFSATKIFLPPSRANPYPAWTRCYGSMWWTMLKRLNHEGVSAIPPVPTTTSSYSFRENTFAKSNFAIDLRNI